MSRIFVCFPLYIEAYLISGLAFFVVLSKTLVKVPFEAFLNEIELPCVSVMALVNHCFYFFLNSIGLEQLGCGRSADIGPGSCEQPSSKAAIDVKLCG